MSALHGLYLVALAVAAFATVVEFPAWRDRVAVGVITGALVVGDVGVRRVSDHRATAVGYFLVVGAVVSAATAVFPTFSLAVFGLLPLAFVRLPGVGAVAVGVVALGLRYVVGPPLHGWMRELGWPHRYTIVIRPWTVYFVLDTIALPVLVGLFTALAMRALRVAGQAEERQRLAHELHDTLAQGLTGVVLRLEAAEQSRPVDMARLVTQARELAGACLVDTRRTVEALRPEPLDDATLADAVARVCDRWSEVTGVPTRFTEHGARGRCQPRVQVVALRVVQEALANTGKHAAATEVAVTVEHRDDELRVVVRDDGCGFDPGDTPRPNGHTSGGLGLATMRERVAAVRGTLSVTSAPGAGTTIVAILPGTGERP